MEFLKVKFDGEDCKVIIDGVTGSWRTNETFQLEAGHHLVSLLRPPLTFSPPEKSVVLAATTVNHPEEVKFTTVRAV
jgi:hypothetical protein